MTSLASVLATHEGRQTTLTVFAPEPLPELATHFDAPGVTVVHEPLPDDGTGGFVAVTRDGEFLGSVPAAAARALTDPRDPRDPGDPSFDERPLRQLFVLLREATFSSFDRRQLLAAAREFEDRAVRVGEGGLHTGFQRLAALRSQADLYEAIAEDTDLDVHVYLDAEWDATAVPGTTVHAERDSELGDYWFVLFDGGPETESACGLLATQREDGYYGFWTYDPTTVNRLVTYLQDTY